MCGDYRSDQFLILVVRNGQRYLLILKLSIFYRHCRSAFDLEPITVLVRSKKWVREWSECPKAVACAWREDENSFVAFSKEIFVPLHPKWRVFRSWKERFFFPCRIT